MQWLPRGVVPAAIARRGAVEVKRLSDRLAAGAENRRRPVGPGGLAALRESPGPQPSQATQASK
jgi:hypothetical protein